MRRWEVTIRWERVEDSPRHTTKWVTHANTPAQLRHLVEAARADRRVIACRYRSIRTLDGAEPTHCPHGHSYAGGSATRAKRHWIACPCGGHATYLCSQCGDLRAEPPPAYDCDPSVPVRTAVFGDGDPRSGIP